MYDPYVVVILKQIIVIFIRSFPKSPETERQKDREKRIVPTFKPLRHLLLLRELRSEISIWISKIISWSSKFEFSR
jgi:hypothetical protein